MCVLSLPLIFEEDETLTATPNPFSSEIDWIQTVIPSFSRSQSLVKATGVLSDKPVKMKEVEPSV
jgi:hypothetical protein